METFVLRWTKDNLPFWQGVDDGEKIEINAVADVINENAAHRRVLDKLADWLERVNDDPLGALTDGFPSPENVVIYLRQKSWEIENKDALLTKETPCP